MLSSDQPVLTQLGLSDKEAEIYQLMLRHGKIPASKILPETSLKRTTVYSILEDLTKKGIVEKDESGAIIEFRAKHPYALKEYLESRVSQIKTAESKLDAVLPDFISFYNSAQNRPGVKFYEGRSGAEKVLADSLTSRTEILSYVDIESIIKYIPDINKIYAAKREKLSIKKRGILIDTPAARKYLENYHTAVTESKLISAEPFPFQTIMQIYDNKISYLTLSGQAMVGVIISDQHIYNMHRYLFEHLWKLTP
ncbi:hypothetical protein GYA54_02090 [Candidatus Kuenenbacteria bacterium]|nr:hypothetical protein [Candidatus Kuenenbacteria bacterium]